MSIPPYEARAQSLGLASKDDVRKAAADPNATWVDVRTEEEIAQGCLHKLYNLPFVHHSCTVDSCEGLEEKAKEHMQDKDAPVIIFCRSGRRATKPVQILKDLGYTNVLNAGGFSDIDFLSK
mmetsp:Transcript_11868/g.24516  ORF Transcript_11868/g.24516 Transcript_11868/m.24516 type:complete len:122 (+) Transcript_11868:181-546(+)